MRATSPTHRRRRPPRSPQPPRGRCARFGAPPDVHELADTRCTPRPWAPQLTGLGRLPTPPADPFMKFEYIPVLAMLALSALVPGIFLAVSALFGPRRPSAIKEQPFECGNVSSGPAWGRFSVKFYLTAILFIVFDVEVVFLYPWALLFRRLGVFGFVEMMIFLFVLTLGLVYVWRKGALEWD